MTTPSPLCDLDDTDRALLAAIQQDGRAPLTDLAGAIHLGTSATRVRMQSLETRGVITGYRADVDATQVGYGLRAIVRMKVHGSLYDNVRQLLDRQPKIVRCARVTGEWCYVFEIVAVNMADLESITSDLSRIGSIVTDLVYEVLVDRSVPV